MAWLKGEDFEFPSPEWANEDGVLAVGGTVSPTTLRRAYRLGIFPWPASARFPVLWFCPAERFVMELSDLRVSRSLRKAIRQERYEITFDRAFDDVMQACAQPREDGAGTWIDQRIAPAFSALHAEGRQGSVSAHLVEAWSDGELAGGLYGVAVGGVFCGESMFFRAPDASKVALVALIERMRQRGFSLLDCQVHTEHLERLGADEIPRDDFLERLASHRDLDRRLV